MLPEFHPAGNEFGGREMTTTAVSHRCIWLGNCMGLRFGQETISEDLTEKLSATKPQSKIPGCNVSDRTRESLQRSRETLEWT